MEQKIFIIGYKHYSFEDEKSGKKHSGVKVSYLTLSFDDDNTIGNLPIQQSLSVDFLEKLKGTGIYLAPSVWSAGAGNKPTVKIIDLKLVKPINLNDFLK